MITDGTSRRPAVKNLADRADRTPGLLLGITMAMGLVFLLFASPYTTPLNPYYGYDSAVFMVLGKGVAAGKLPYLDLYDNKGPMIFYINALGYILGGRTGVFFLQVVFMGLSLALLYRLARLYTDIPRAWLALVVFAFVYCGSVGEGNMTEEWSVLFTVLPLYLGLRFLRTGVPAGEHPLGYSLLYGLCFGVQLLFRVTNAAPLGGLLLAFAVILVREKSFRALWKNMLVVLAGTAAVIGPFLLYFWRIGAMESFLYASLLHNFHYAAGGAAAKSWGDWLNMLLRISLTPVTVVLGVRQVRRGTLSFGSALVLSCVSAVGAAAMAFGHSYKHYFLLLAPAIVAGFALGMKEVAEAAGRSRGWRRRLCALVLVLCVAPYTVQSAIHAGKSILFNFFGYMDDQVRAMEEMNGYITEDRDKVWGFDIRANVYLYLDVVPCFRHFTTQTWMAEDSPFIMTEIQEMMDREAPVWIIAGSGEDVRAWLVDGYGYELVLAQDYGGSLSLYHRPRT